MRLLSIFDNSSFFILISITITVASIYIFFQKYDPRKRKSGNWIQIVVSIFVVISTIGVFISQYSEFEKKISDNKLKSDLLDESMMFRKQLDSLLAERNFIWKQLSDSLKNIPDQNVQFIQFSQNLDSLKKEVMYVRELTLGLRQSINPVNPEEILSIVRLQDQINSLRVTLDDIKKNTESRLKNFEESVTREMSSSSSSTNLILVVLIPLVLNFLYTLWKDFRKPTNPRPDTQS